MEDTLSRDQQTYLLDLARRTIGFYLEKGNALKEKTNDPALLEKRGAFVTLKVDDELRGCIGYPLPHKALFQTIIDCAIAAATQDFRFPAIKIEELPRLTIEISVLTLPRTVKDISEITVGEHGIILSKGSHRGLLLPQVPLEWDWDLETYLNHGCLKAGLAEDEWKKGATIEIFSAQVFSESFP
ncbi:MAG: AmmeMemoRadiSam system protein A [Candidatus Aminicenantes bacterium]|jgi:AmmeMemoRadiSam system protein A